jgi:hypothetical protein
VRGISFLGTVVALAMVAQYILGASISLLPGRVETLITQGTSYSGITRILPPGQSLILLSFVTSTTTIILEESKSFRIFRFLQIGLLGAAVIFTFNRSYWVMVILAMAALAYMAKREHRHRFVVFGFIALLLVGILVSTAFVEPESPFARLLSAYFDRLATLGNANTLKESSLRFRYVENEYVIPNIISHPLLGLGLGSRYRPFDPRIDHLGMQFDMRRYIHNAHFWIMMKTGLLGYASFIWLSTAFLVRGFRYWRLVPNIQLKSYVLGSTLTYLGVLLGAVVNPMLIQWFWVPVIGMMMGINEVILRNMVPENATHERLIDPCLT